MVQFVRVTEPVSENVRWINLDYVRQLVVLKPTKHLPVRTMIQIDSGWGAQSVEVTQTPEEILGV
jgi:hypothetical protein